MMTRAGGGSCGVRAGIGIISGRFGAGDADDMGAQPGQTRDGRRRGKTYSARNHCIFL